MSSCVDQSSVFLRVWQLINKLGKAVSFAPQPTSVFHYTAVRFRGSGNSHNPTTLGSKGALQGNWLQYMTSEVCQPNGFEFVMSHQVAGWAQEKTRWKRTLALAHLWFIYKYQIFQCSPHNTVIQNYWCNSVCFSQDLLFCSHDSTSRKTNARMNGGTNWSLWPYQSHHRTQSKSFDRTLYNWKPKLCKSFKSCLNSKNEQWFQHCQTKQNCKT